MNRNLLAADISELSLPNQVITKIGVRFDPRTHHWNYRDAVTTVSMDFSSIQKIVPQLINPIKLSLIWYAEHRAAHHLKNMFERLQHFFINVPVVDVITEVHLLNYRAFLSRENAWYFGALSGFLKKWHSLGYPGVTDNAIKLIKSLRVAGNTKGEAVLTMDPVDGPYSDIEYEAIQIALNDAYAKGQIDLEGYVLVWLFMLLGQRPSQIALLKVCDVVAPTSDSKSPNYILLMPRVKQRGEMPRTEFKERLLTPQVGRLLVRYAELCKESFEGRIPDPSQAPLFPERRNRFPQPDSLVGHRTSLSLSLLLTTTLAGLEVYSERTGELLHVTATRFRRTIGTRAAGEGHSELLIAEILDHSDTQNVGVYVQATPEIVENIDRAVAHRLAPLAQAFAGKIIVDESQATRGDDPSSRIVDPRFDPTFSPLASCGKPGFCGFSAPIACYTCSSFEPWLDGPHEQVLEYLLAERDRLTKSADQRIASINDRTIFAVAQVIEECQKITGQKEEGV